MKGSEHIETARLVLRKPTAADAEAVYTRYSGDTEVTKYVGWPRHQSIEQTKAFLAFSEAEWNRWPAGPYLIERQGNRKATFLQNVVQVSVPGSVRTAYVT